MSSRKAAAGTRPMMHALAHCSVRVSHLLRIVAVHAIADYAIG
jgi:hypothetical protein